MVHAHFIQADAEKFSIYKTIESKVKVPIAYRTRQCDMLSVPESTSFTWRLSVKTAPEIPRFIIVGFQTAKDGDQTKNPSTFDHVNLRNVYVMLNPDRYPVVEYNLSFSKEKFSRVYGVYTLFAFDVSKQKEKLKSSVVDIQIKANFTENVPANTRAFALVISDQMLLFQSDGNKMSVTY